MCGRIGWGGVTEGEGRAGCMGRGEEQRLVGWGRVRAGRGARVGWGRCEGGRAGWGGEGGRGRAGWA